MKRSRRDARWRLIPLGLAIGCVLAAAPGSGGPRKEDRRTPDGRTPAEEQVCDGLPRAEFGLCNAYCEAIDCDLRDEPLKACESLRDNYFELTGLTAFPCDASCPDLPDPTCSGNGVVGLGDDGCDVCLCAPEWGGPDCATCEVGFDRCGVCGGNNDCQG